jgi:SAM-dependent methyltransferase
MAKQTWLDRLESTRPYQSLRQGMNRQLVGFLRKQAIEGRGPVRIAEVACGSGYAAHLLASLPEVTLSIAADLNLEDFLQAKIENYRACFVRSDLFMPSLTKGSLDLVWNSSSVEELDDPVGAVKAMAWVTKPRGFVFVGVPHSLGAAGLLGILPGRKTREWLGRVYSRKDLRDLVSSAGLTVRQETSYLFGTFIGVLAQKHG